MTALILVFLLSAQPAAATAAPAAPTSQQLASIWDGEHISPAVPPLMDHAQVMRLIDQAHTAAPSMVAVEEVGRSVEGRALRLVTVGRGTFRVLLWSQMHGDEPTATAALFDLFEYLRRHESEPVARRILDNLTLYVIPMLNPDGAERYQRRNAQGIDINRDALLLQSPEGRVLKSVRDRLQPRIGFNLHNQNWRTSVGTPPRPATISLLSVAFDKAGTLSEGRVLTKKTCAVIRDALEPLAPGQIGRYDEDFEVRAFGDNLTLWGTPVVLIETGPWASAQPDPYLVRLNFVAILTALDALATGRVTSADPARYESLPVNDDHLFYILIKHASIVNGAGIPPFLGDLGIATTRRVRSDTGGRAIVLPLTIDDVGDLRVFSGLTEIDATGLTVAPLIDPSLQPGAEVALPADWSALQPPRTIAVGQPAALAVLKPTATPGRFTLVRVIQ